jgi:hypothetical protein
MIINDLIINIEYIELTSDIFLTPKRFIDPYLLPKPIKHCIISFVSSNEYSNIYDLFYLKKSSVDLLLQISSSKNK